MSTITNFQWLDVTTISKLLLSERQCGDYPVDPRLVCSVSDVLISIEALKKGGRDLTNIRSGDTELQKGLATGQFIDLSLDSYALQAGLFDVADKGMQLSPACVEAAHPGDSLKFVVSLAFDSAFGTEMTRLVEEIYG